MKTIQYSQFHLVFNILESSLDLFAIDLNARLGSLSSDFQCFTPWKVVNEKAKINRLDFGNELQNLLNGLITPKKLLDYVRYFVLFERASNVVRIKKIAAYHQYYGVNETVEFAEELTCA